MGCELGPDNASVPTAVFALNGEEFMRFEPRNGTWLGDWPEAETIREKWKQQAEAVRKERTFLLNSCPQRLLGHLERGRGNLEWKGEPPPVSGLHRPLHHSLAAPLTFPLQCPHTVPEGLSPPRAALPVPLWLSREIGRAHV